MFEDEAECRDIPMSRFLLSLSLSVLLALFAIVVGLNVVEVGLSVWEVIPWRS